MKGQIMQHGPRKGEEIKTLQDVKDYLNWQYENGLITEKNRHDGLIMARIEFPDEVDYTPSPWNNKEDQPQYGLIIPGIVRDNLVNQKIMDYNQAVDFSNIIDERLQGADWLTLYDGTTYTKTYEPKGK